MTSPTDLRALVERLVALSERRLASRPPGDAAAKRARELADHLAGHVRVRATSLESPLVVVLVGPTGAGKSTIFNTIADRPVSETGVLRPTTRTAVVLVHPDDRASLADGAFARVPGGHLRFVEDPSIERGLVLVDAPDIDSLEHANRDLADRLVEAADLCLFVTTATRYADRVPWDVLDRVRERGLPLEIVVNRMPPDPAGRAEILADVDRLSAEAGLAGVRSGDGGPHRAVIAVPEGALDASGERLMPGHIGPVLEEIARLRGDREARIALATRALAGSLHGLGESLDRVADDAEHESIDTEALRRIAERSFEAALAALRDELGRGTFLREQALRHWQEYVGADQMTRFFSEGIGRIRGAIAAVFRPATPPVAEVRAATMEDLIAAARLQAADAARRTATAWSDMPSVGRTVADAPGLWGATPDFDARLATRLDAWIEGIVSDIQRHGSSKRLLARGASVGVNVLGTGVMLGTFIHTGGLTGAELGVAAATALLNQKLLGALFGEAAMVELIAGARRRLGDALATTFDEERVGFHRLLRVGGALPHLATDLGAAPRDVRAVSVADQ